jgi:hypothetical protein
MTARLINRILACAVALTLAVPPLLLAQTAPPAPAQAAPPPPSFYRILTAQGPDAPGGAYDYVAHGRMIGGFALVAFPAQYGISGMMTFIVNHDGVVYQKDLGPNTAAIARGIKLFNPDGSWKKT